MWPPDIGELAAGEGRRGETGLLIEVDPNRFAEGRLPSGIGHPQNGILRDWRIGMTAQVGEIDEAHRRDAIFLNPFEDGAEICPPATLGL